MSNVTHKYETILVTNPTLGDEAVNSLVEKFKTLISQNGTIENVDDWGTRRLAYPINHLTEGHYTLITFQAPAEFPAELDRIYNITDGVIRSIIVAKEE